MLCLSSCRKSPSSPSFPLGSCMAVASAASSLLAALREWDSVSSVVGMTFCVPLGRCDWFRESLSCGVGLSCLRQQLPRPQAVCGLLWHLSLGQSMIYNKMVGPCGTLKGCGHGRLRGKGQHTGRTLDCNGPVPTSSLPQPSLQPSWASRASLTLYLCSCRIPYLPGPMLPVLAGPSHELFKPMVIGNLYYLHSN